MTPEEREDLHYSNGKTNPIDIEEQTMFSLLPVAKYQKLLDVGCGVGTISLKLKERGFNVFGIDFSSVAIEKVREKGINALKIDLDKEGIKFEDNFFDIVWAGDVIEHVFDPIFVLKEINRVLAPGGLLLCTIPYDLRISTRIRMLFGHSFQENIYRQYGQCKHHTFFSLPLMKYMFEEALMQIKDVRFVIRFPKTRKDFITKNRGLVYFARSAVINANSNST